MEHQLLTSLLNRNFYNATKLNLKSELFNKDLRKIKSVIDKGMEKYERDLTLDEVKALFFVANPTLTTSQKHQFQIQFNLIVRAEAITLVKK